MRQSYRRTVGCLDRLRIPSAQCSQSSQPCTCLIFSALLPNGTESQMLTRELNLHSPSSLIGARTKMVGVFSPFSQWKSQVRLSFFADIFSPLVHIQQLCYSNCAVCFGILSLITCPIHNLTYLAAASLLAKNSSALWLFLYDHICGWDQTDLD